MENKEKRIPKYCFEIPLSGVDYIYQSSFSHIPVVVMKPLLQPLERIPEETRPTGEEEVKKLEDWLVCEICMKQSDRKRMDKELIRRGEFEVETRKRVKRVLSLAREEGKEEQAELDRKIYGMSVEEFSKNYKVVEPLQNGEREEQLKDKIDDIVDDCIEWEESWDGERIS